MVADLALPAILLELVEMEALVVAQAQTFLSQALLRLVDLGHTAKETTEDPLRLLQPRQLEVAVALVELEQMARQALLVMVA